MDKSAVFLKKSHNITEKGQVFTPPYIVSLMTNMIENGTSILEPSCGHGIFLKGLRTASTVAIEIDGTICPDNALNLDFFDYDRTHRFNTIIGNPPYVRQRDILESTLAKLKTNSFDKRTNLYIFFIDKCMDHLQEGGELIFITPRAFFKATSAIPLNQRLFLEGSFTHFNDLGDTRIFEHFSPICAIWRWVKGRQNRRLYDGRTITCHHGQLSFDHKGTNLSDVFSVHVGAVSGADDVYTSSRGNVDFVCSMTKRTGNTRRMIYDITHDQLFPHKERLLRRGIRPFNETNWWKWGRKCVEKKGKRIYVNVRTRAKNPFFTHNCTYWDGAVLALFPKRSNTDILKWIDILNKQDWKKKGFVSGGRFFFTQRALENVRISQDTY